MIGINSYGTRKEKVVSVRMPEALIDRANQHAHHVLGYKDLSSFIRDAVEEKISGFDPQLNARRMQADRNLNRIAGVLMRYTDGNRILPARSQRKLAKLLERCIKDIHGVIGK